MAGIYCPPADVALLGQARRLLLVLQLPVQMAVLAVLPLAARLYAEGRLEELERIVRRAAASAALFAVPVAVVFLAVPGLILSLLFGEFYRQGAPLLVALSIGQLIAVHNGIAGYILIVAGRQRAVVLANALTAALMMIVGSIAAAQGGVLGMSIASATILAGQSTLEWWLARRLLDVRTHMDWKAPRPPPSALHFTL